MATKFRLKIVSQDGKKVVDDADILNIVTTNGALGILAHHLPLVSIVEISHLNYRKDNEVFEFAISGGVLNVKDDEVIVLAETFESKEEIDLERAKSSKDRAEKRLKNPEAYDIKRAEASLLRALNRLSL